MNKFKKFFLASIASLSIFASTSCGLFGSPEEGVMISAISASTNKDGDTELKITFTDDDIEPLIFLIPKGEKGETGLIGEQGVGIKSIESIQSEDGLKTIIQIDYTDEEVPSTYIDVKNGVSVVDITSVINEENNTSVLTFKLSNGESKSVEVPNGKDGIGVKEVTTIRNERGDYIVTISYTGDREDSVITLPYQNGQDGKDGRGIESIVGTETKEGYVITINYNDNTSQDLAPINIPKTTKWLQGPGEPTEFDKNMANSGDYYFDIANYVIYLFDGAEFNEIVNLTEQNSTTTLCEVTFDPNGGKFIKGKLTNGKLTVKKGQTIPAERIPLCEKEGMKFVGYYATPEGPATIFSDKLTDMVPIYENMTFYAHYE